MYPKRTAGKRCALACASLLAAIGTLLMFFTPWFYTVITSFALSLTTKSTFDLWQKVPIPLYLEFYVFNWTNPEDVYKQNVKPHFEEIGPFVFRETKEKVNITWNPNNTITFNQLRYWYFEESRSCCKLSTKITTINSIALVASNILENWSYVVKKGFDISISALSTKLWKETTVDELLFSGYEDTLINLARSMPQLKNLPIPDYDRFGWFYKRNGSYDFDGTFNMVYSGPNFGKTKEWQYNDYMSYYDKRGECNTVRGSAGEFFSPKRERDEIGFFSPDICRYVPLTYVNDEDIDGTTGYKYIFGDSFLDNGTKVPENRCYCGDYCSPYGALNISTCKHNAPGFVSQPHFYDADPYYLDQIGGLNPTKKKHQMFMVIEPETGIPLHVEARLQLSLLVKPIKSISILENIPTFHFPVIWFQQTAKISPSLHLLLKILLHAQLILRSIGGVMAIVGIPWIMFLLHEPFARMCRKPRKKSRRESDFSVKDSKDSANPLMKLEVHKGR